jgi:hypothetical protein
MSSRPCEREYEGQCGYRRGYPPVGPMRIGRVRGTSVLAGLTGSARAAVAPRTASRVSHIRRNRALGRGTHALRCAARLCHRPLRASALGTQVGVGWRMGMARRVMGGGGRGESDSMANHVAGAGLLFTSPKGHRWSKRRIRGNQHRMGYTEQPTHCDRRLLSNAARGCRLSRRTGTV